MYNQITKPITQTFTSYLNKHIVAFLNFGLKKWAGLSFPKFGIFEKFLKNPGYFIVNIIWSTYGIQVNKKVCGFIRSETDKIILF